jgi:high-affinity K+ transport system ATPase subunit B
LELGIDAVPAEVSPGAKADAVKQLHVQGRVVATALTEWDRSESARRTYSYC